MNPTFWITYLVLAGAAVVQALLLLLQTWENRRYSRSCMRDLARHRPSGRAVILAPCKGSEPALRQNLLALFQQDYPDYEITFIVQQASDPACAVIGRLMAEHPDVTARLLVAGRASHCGQKVHNLRAGAAALGPQVRYLVFVDSDARPRPEWLRAAIGELERPDLGATSGYRWFMPSRPSLAHHVLYSINCNLISLLSSRNHYMIWGGSWAIRRDTFEATGLREAWKGTLSDDLVASGVLRRAAPGPLRARLHGGLAAGLVGGQGVGISPPAIHGRPALRLLVVARGRVVGDLPQRSLAGQPVGDRLRAGPGMALAVDSRRTAGHALWARGVPRLVDTGLGWSLFSRSPLIIAGGTSLCDLGRPAGRHGRVAGAARHCAGATCRLARHPLPVSSAAEG